MTIELVGGPPPSLGAISIKYSVAIDHTHCDHSAMFRILVVEDDQDLRSLLSDNLRYEGFSVESASNGPEALELHRHRAMDLILLDLMLPSMDGFAVLRALRTAHDPVPILVLSARGSELDKVRGLGFGADDYMVKPFSTIELIARIRAMLRRIKPGLSDANLIQSGPYTLNRTAIDAFREGKPLGLTPREFRIMGALLAQPGHPVSREALIKLAWEADARPTVRTIDVHIGNLRRKLGEEGRFAIATIEGEGYLWRWSLSVPEPTNPQASNPVDPSL